jgi:hypothetical protein
MQYCIMWLQDGVSNQVLTFDTLSQEVQGSHSTEIASRALATPRFRSATCQQYSAHENENAYETTQ